MGHGFESRRGYQPPRSGESTEDSPERSLSSPPSPSCPAWVDRAGLEAREAHLLADYATPSSAHGGRRWPEPEDAMRTAFQRDRDRVIHSAAFRRLQHKTQVLAATRGDHHRSRMTHSLEVGQMARSVALALRLNPDLAEVVALAHDLGHPPFGHVGERTLDELMAAQGGFRHNAQGLRIVDYLEDRYGHGHGLNLTLAVRRSLLKGEVPAGYPLARALQASVPAPLEARVVDLCDRIAYLCHDLDDGLRVGAFSCDEIGRLELWQRARRAAGSPRPSRVVSEMVAILIHDLVEASAAALAASPRPDRPIRHGPETARMAGELLAFLRERFYGSPLVLDGMEKGRRRIRALFSELVAHPEALPDSARARVEIDGIERAVCDYVAGMTDRYLLERAPPG